MSKLEKLSSSENRSPETNCSSKFASEVPRLFIPTTSTSSRSTRTERDVLGSRFFLHEAILLVKQTKAEEEAKNKSDCSVLLDDLPNLQNSDFWTIINKDGRVFFLDFELPPAPAVCSSVIVSSGLRVQVFFSETHLNKCGYVLFPHTLCNLIDLKAVLHVVEEFQRNICTDPFQKMHYLLQLVATLLEEVSDEHVPSKLQECLLEVVKFGRSQVELVLNNADRHPQIFWFLPAFCSLFLRMRTSSLEVQ
ncbi:hypothetical protein HPB48_008664 [Haemaphysalis longicornis]|uniref:Uncharacterized protein n=1 Tax=Haemaphysalis longicornis TaxID=44386 RepID=A0A9J6GL79_HAELO|nr:hypothetical protein HPB48_008664 [Haemaphysalis longicornis]